MLFEEDGQRRGLTATATADAFGRQAQKVVDGWLERRSAGTTRRAEGPNSWFKREAYVLIGYHLENGSMRAFSRIALADRRPNRLITEAAKNPFKLGLLAILADDSILTRANRHVFGNQMLFAYAHDVPPDFLNAFLAVSGGPLAVAAKLKTEEPEPGFEHRFKPERLAELHL